MKNATLRAGRLDEVSVSGLPMQKALRGMALILRKMTSPLVHWALPLFVALAQTADAAEPILLKAGAIWAAGGANRLQSNAMTSEKPSRLSEPGLYIIQREGVTTPEWREGIRKAGATIRGYVPENAYIIEVTPEAFDKIVADVEHAQLIEYKARYRVDPRVVEKVERGRAQTNGVGLAAETARTEVYEISLFDRNATERIVGKLKQLAGAEVEAAYGSVIRAKLTDEALETVAGWIEVEWVEIYVPAQLHNNVAVQARRLNVETVWPGGATPLGLTGAGQVVAVADTGLDTGNTGTLHADVRGRVIRAYARGRVNDWSDPNGHGTHVVGSVLGNGANSSSPKIRGVAYEASLIMQSLLDSSGGINTGIGDLQNLFRQAYETETGLPGARIHSNSWGSPQAGKYTSNSQALDAFMFEHPDFLAVFSAGNDGIDANKDGVTDLRSLGAPATAKNCITVGSCENHRTSGGIAGMTYSRAWPKDFPANPIASDYLTTGPDGKETYGMAASSSRGPCADGRVKPDIVAPGQQVLSLRSSKASSSLESYYAYDSYYRYNQGTSMAAPLVAGSAALVRQWLVENQRIPNPDGATVKAVLLAGARSMTPGQYGTGAAREIPAAYPNNVEGWGLADVGNAVANSRGVQVYDGRVITDGEAQSFPVRVTAAGGKIAVVMAYTDAAASLSSSKQLVNDLDLTVTTPSGIVLYPNSRTSADRVNNVEGVRIDSAEAGTYTVTVRAYAINAPMGTATEGMANAVRYSLVVNGGSASGSSAPANDNFSSAATVSGNSGTTTGTNVGATFQSGEPLLVYEPTATTTVWWKWTAPASGRVQFDTIGTGFDTVMGVYRGSSFSSLAKAAEDDDGGGNGASKCVCNCTSGVTYYICVGGRDASAGTVRLNWDLTVIAPTPASLSISGSSSVKSGGTTTYVCTATMNDGTTKTVTPTWTIISGADFATINSSGTLLAGAVAVQKSVTIQASYTEGGVTKTATKTVTITVLSSLSISGSASVLGGSSSTYACTAKWSDGTSTTVTPTWAIVSGASYASISSSGKLTTVAVTSQKSVTIQASYKAGGVTKTATKTISITAPISLGTAVDNADLTFTTGGSALWSGQTGTTHDGVDAARSGIIGDSQNSWMQTTVTGPGTISFWWAVSSEWPYDCLEFLVDGAVRNSISGTSGTWSQKTYSITSGSHTFQWCYRKDYSVSSGQDAGFVDQIVWTAEGSDVVIPGVVTLPVAEVDAYMAKYPALAARAGGDRVAFCTLPSVTGKLDADGNQMLVWQDIVAGTDPNNAQDVFTAKIAMGADGKPVVTWEPALNGEGKRRGARTYRVMGSVNLRDWTECAEGREGDYNYFRVSVEMP